MPKTLTHPDLIAPSGLLRQPPPGRERRLGHHSRR
jgi:hypothetical protein